MPNISSAQLTISTKATLPPAPLTRSIILGDRLAELRAQWRSPVNAYQQLWVKTISGRADATPSAGEPADFGAAAVDSSIAQAAGLRYAMIGAPADLKKSVAALLNAKLPRRNEDDFITFPEILTSYLAAYDYIRAAPAADLPAETRTEIESRLLRLARSLTNGNSTASNALGKNGATRALAGLLLGDQALLKTGLNNLQTHYNYSTTDDGWFTDSQSVYLNYTLRHLALFARAYQQASGVDVYPAVQPLLDLSMALRKPDGTIPNVSNGVNWPVGVHLFTCMPDKAKAGLMLWNLEQTPVDGFAGTNLENNDYSLSTFFALTNFSVKPTAPATSPTFLASGQSAVAVFRSDWSKSSDYLLMSPGVDSAPFLSFPAFHSHNDTGEILVAAKGHYLLVAAGYNRTNLSNSPAGFASQTPENHNVLLVDGGLGNTNEGRMMRPERFVLTDRLDATERGDFKGACDFATLKMKYGGADVSRSSAFPNEDYFIVADRIQAAKSHAYGFNLIGRGEMKALTEMPNLIEVKWEHGGAQIVEHLVSAQPMTLATGATFMHDEFNKYEPTQRMTATQQAAAANFLSLIEMASADGDAKLKIANLSTLEFAALEVKFVDKEYQDWILSQAASAPRAVGPLSTDAEFGYLRHAAGALDSAMIARGTELTDGGRPILRSDHPLTISLSFGGSNLRGTISADDFTPGSALELFDRQIASASLNGQSLEFTNAEGQGRLVLTGPGVLEVEFQSGPKPFPLLLWGIVAATIGGAVVVVGLAWFVLRQRRG
ncbi:MAG TPA: heparinase II/III family protein [Pirellulales bacterium]